MCHFCGKRVYLMEKLSAEGRFFHHGCFKYSIIFVQQFDRFQLNITKVTKQNALNSYLFNTKAAKCRVSSFFHTYMHFFILNISLLPIFTYHFQSSPQFISPCFPRFSVSFFICTSCPNHESLLNWFHCKFLFFARYF